MNTMPPMPPTPPLTKKQKIIIISVIVFLLLSYAGTLGLFATQEDGEHSSDSESPGWTKTLSSVMSIFATKATLDGITCNGNPVSSEFTLSSSNSAAANCKITFNESNLPDYSERDEDSLWKTEVEVLSADTKIYTKYESSPCSGKTDSGRIKTTSLPAAALGLTHLASKTDDDGNVISGQYHSESSLNCWLEQEDTSVSFTLSQAGESLILSCNGCTAQKPIKLKLVE